MRIAFFVNDVRTEQPRYTTVQLGLEALQRGHDVWFIGVDDFMYEPDDHLRAYGYVAAQREWESAEALLQSFRDTSAARERITVDTLDVLMLRNDPADDAQTRPWAQGVGVIFGEAAKREGVLVLNDPAGLARASSKLYFQYLPPELRPRTLVTRHPGDIRRLVEELGDVVLKPLQGSRGRQVFKVGRSDLANFRQIVEAVGQQGYIVAQEYLPEAAAGDVRLLMINGRPLEHAGRVAAFRRLSTDGDIRSNIHAGGRTEPVEVDGRILDIAAQVRPLLLQDGMFLVGVDIAGDKVMEINVFSPGGIGTASRLQDAPFAAIVLEDLERKVELRRRYRRPFDNRLLATI